MANKYGELHQQCSSTRSASVIRHSTSDSGEETEHAEDRHPGHVSSLSSTPVKPEGKPIKKKSISIQPPQMMYMMTAVVGILCAVSVYSFYTNPPQNSQVLRLLESLEKYGYSNLDNLEVKKPGYGYPDLLTEDLKKQFVASWTRKVARKKDISVKEGEKIKEGVTTTAGLSGVKMWNGPEHQYVVVFDAGSSGTRLHVFLFECKNTRVMLQSEVFHRAKPGLSEYVHHPDQGAASLQGMIDAAMEKVPLLVHRSTPLIFKATAGFRLLNNSGANGLLFKVRDRFATTDFSFSPDSINIMSGTEEGLCGWITINYLLGTLDGSSLTAAALDLGGASIQLTYMPQNMDKFTQDVHRLELMGSHYNLYTHSYLGIGLLAARNSTLRDKGDGTLTSDCLPVKYSGIFTYGGENHTIRGPEAPSRDGCWMQVGEFLSSRHIRPPWDFIENEHDPDIYLFSYFYETLQWAGVIGDETEKIVTVQDFYHAAGKVCELQDLNMPFLCQDLTYISRLLGEAFMLWDKPLHVVSEINSWETSWSLGAALEALSKMES